MVQNLLKEVNCHLKPSWSVKILMLPSTKTNTLYILPNPPAMSSQVLAYTYFRGKNILHNITDFLVDCDLQAFRSFNVT